MTEAEPNRTADPPSVVVAGHICLDIIPRLSAAPHRRAPRSGSLDVIGPVTLAVGGCVGNTGIALHRLGLRPTLIARVGDDRPGEDRSIAHFPGVNDTFVADDVPQELLRAATLLHVGYPPLMAALVADDGHELRRLLARARGCGVITSLDMANANLDPGAGGVRWRQILERVLPDVDVFLPSLAEACHLLGRRVRRDEQGAPTLASVARLADELVDMGVGIAGVKLGEHGLYVRHASTARMSAGSLRLPSSWPNREIYSTVFETLVVGTAGAGDTTIAGFLFGLLTGRSPDETVTAACAVGESSTEAADGASGVPSWREVEWRLRRGWRRKAAVSATGWAPSRDGGLWYGPRNAPGSGE